MRFDDWNSAPAGLREVALTRMFARYSHALEGPDVWRRMSVADWDRVPPPVRVIAILRMIDRWVAHYAGYVETRRAQEIADTVAAIVMVESWFESGGENRGLSGNRDLGLAQVSDSCRRTLDRLFRCGAVDFAASEDDYFNPFVGTRAAAFWFIRLLAQAGGDLHLAVRAYHRGIDAARRGAGEQYLANVLAKRTVLVGNRDAPPASRFALTLAHLAESSR